MTVPHLNGNVLSMEVGDPQSFTKDPTSRRGRLLTWHSIRPITTPKYSSVTYD